MKKTVMLIALMAMLAIAVHAIADNEVNRMAKADIVEMGEWAVDALQMDGERLTMQGSSGGGSMTVYVPGYDYDNKMLKSAMIIGVENRQYNYDAYSCSQSATGLIYALHSISEGIRGSGFILPIESSKFNKVASTSNGISVCGLESAYFSYAKGGKSYYVYPFYIPGNGGKMYEDALYIYFCIVEPLGSGRYEYTDMIIADQGTVERMATRMTALALNSSDENTIQNWWEKYMAANGYGW